LRANETSLQAGLDPGKRTALLALSASTSLRGEFGGADVAHEARSATWKTYAVAALFWLPLLSGVISRFVKQSNWFGDYGAVACAAERFLQGAPIYDVNLACPGMHAAMYIYHPWVAQAFAAPMEALGRDGLLMAYTPIFVAAVLFMLWLMVGKAGTAERRKRAWFGAFMTGSAIYWGNVAVVLHGLIAFCATVLRRWPIALMLAIALAMIVKPLFAVFCMIFVLMDRPLIQRGLYAAGAVILGLAPSVWALFYGGELAQQWRELVEYVIFIDRPGEAYLGWMSAIGADMSSLAVAVGYLGYASVIALAGLALAEGLDLNDEDRVMLGLSLGLLINPRLMSQDYWLLGPGLLAVTTIIAQRAPATGKLFERALLWLCVVVLIANLADLSDYLSRVVTLGLVLTVLAAAGWTLYANRANLGALWPGLLRAPTALPTSG
jgi:hypothetical protein